MLASMNIGMLWFDNDPKTDLATKIVQAASYYQNKYGRRPNLCFVNPGMLVQIPKPDGIEVRSNQTILPHHLWLGLNE